MPYTPNTTWVDGSGGGTPISAARLNNLESGVTMTYDTYTPTWTASGSAPSFGNAVIVARYVKRGKWVHAYGRITFGTTSSFGTGTYTFALPAGAAQPALGQWGDLTAFDASTNNFNLAKAGNTAGSTSLMQGLYGASVVGSISVYAQTVPWTWANGDVLEWNLVYEAA
jgi:hypothetical protein